MTKVKDGFWKQLGSKVGSDDYLLKAAGGYIGVGNSAGEVVPLNNSTRNEGLNADMVDGYHFSDLEDRYVNVSGDWMNDSAQLYWKGINGSTSVYTRMGYYNYGPTHAVDAHNNTKAFYIMSNGYDAGNDWGGLSIDDEGVSIFGAGDAANNFTGVFRVFNEDNFSDGPQFLVHKSAGAYIKYNLSIGQQSVNTSYRLYVNGGLERIDNNSRYLILGPQNSNHAHYETNADISHWFNKRVDVNGAIWRYNTNYGIADDGQFYAKTIYANRDGASTYGGISLYSTSDPITEYGIAFRGTGSYGKLGRVQGDWATYFTMDSSYHRGWIFRSGGTNYASVSARGEAYFSAVGTDNYIAYPSGGFFSSGGSTGYIIITIPANYRSCTMMRFNVEIYNYSTGTSTTYTIGGYNYDDGNWYNVFAYANRQGTTGFGNLTVRFGHNGSNSIIWIGESNISYSYPKVRITNVILGHSTTDYNTWASGWSVTIATTAPTNVSQTVTNPATNYYAESVPWSGVTGKPTSKTIWGQTYIDANGTFQNVTNSLYLPNNAYISWKDSGGTDRIGLWMTVNDVLFVGRGMAEAGQDVCLSGNNLNLTYGTSKSTGIYINSSGNVGINTTSPTTKLDIRGGSILVDAFTTGNETGIFFRNGFTASNKYNVSILAYDHIGDTTSPDGLSINGYDGISFCTGSNNRNEVVRITGGSSPGNVGIGTTSPGYKLTVSGNIYGDSITMGEASGYFRYRTASSLESGFYFHSSGRESVVFANEYAHTGWIFANGIKPSNRTQWNALGVTPALQIHHNAIYINRAVRDADTSDYNLYVDGTVYTTNRYCFPHGGSSYAWDRINEGYNRTSIRAYCTAGESASGARDNYSIGLMIDGYYSFALAGYGGGATLAWRNNSGTWYDIITSQNIGSQSVNYANSAGNSDTLDDYHADTFLTIGTKNLVAYSESIERNSSTEYMELVSPHQIYLKYGTGWYTISFDIYTDVAGSGSLYSSPGTNSRFNFDSQSVTTTTSWQHKVYRINVVDSNSSYTWSSISVYFGYGSGAKVHVRNVKLEKGRVESTFSYPDDYFLHRNNYTDFTVKKDGTGATGTWNINITGNAATASGLSVTHYWANVPISTTSLTNTSPTVSTIYATNWIRTYNNTGWFNESYEGGIYMQDTTYVRIYNGKAFYTSNGNYYSINTEGGFYGKLYTINSENYLIKPPKAIYTTSSDSHSGCITITLPTSIGNTMVSMWIDIYNYVTQTSFSVHVGGYTYQNSTWQHSPFAMVYGANHRVRLGHNGSNFIIYIGETSSTWNYPQVSVRDVLIGFSQSFSNWCKDWTISFSTSVSNVTYDTTTYIWSTKNLSLAPNISSVTYTPYGSDYYNRVVTNHWLAYWNGAYNTSGNSNLQYCDRGRFGNIVTYSTSDFASSSHNHDGRYTLIYSGSSDYTFTSLAAADRSSVGMIYAATDNPLGSAGWVHCWSQTWTKGSTANWVSQIALGTTNGNGMWYRCTSGNIDGLAWKRVIDSSNIGSQSVNYANSAGNADTVDYLHKTDLHTLAHYGTTASYSYYKISINSYTYWMMAFTVRIYQSYAYYDIRFSGYNYGGNHWYAPTASMTDGDGSLTVYFGYDSDFHLWVCVPGGSYSGIDIISFTNGYYQTGLTEKDLFTITAVSSVPSTIQSTQTIYRPLKTNESTSVSVSNSNPGLGKSSATIATIGGTAITAYVNDSDKVDGLHFWTGAQLPNSPSSDTIYIIV